MSNNIATLLPYLTLVSHVVFVIALSALIFRNSWGRDIQMFLGRHALVLAFLASLVAVVASLFYSEVIGYEPCLLCWWTRVFLYPLTIIFGLALWKKSPKPFLYAMPFTLLAGLLSLYYSYTSLGGESFLSCTEAGNACAKVYVLEFGYITLPMMGLTITLFILLFAWANRIYRNENRNA